MTVKAPKKSYALQKLCRQQEEIAKLIAAEEAAEKERAIVAASKRQQAYEHMAWHPEFDVHNLAKLRVVLDGAAQEMPASIFCTPAARNLLAAVSSQLSCEQSQLSIDQRRELIATTFEKIIAAAQPSFWLRAKMFLSSLFSR